MATISVPQLELDAAVYEGVTSVLDTGPGHWPGTAASGGNGNLVITGHRSTSGSVATLNAPHPPCWEQYRNAVRARLVSMPRPPGV